MVTLAIFPIGCGLTSQGRQEAFPTQTPQQVLGAARESLSRSGYRIAREDEKEGVLQTDWKVQLSLRFYEGIRRRVLIRVTPRSEGGCAVEILCHKEINEDASNPIHEPSASWSGSEKDEDEEARLAMQLKIRLTPMSLGGE